MSTLVYFGPPTPVTSSIQLSATIESSTTNSSQVGALLGKVGTFGTTMFTTATGQAVLGAASQTTIAQALTDFDTYVTANLTTTDNISLINSPVTDADLRAGKLVYTGVLHITKTNALGSTKLEVGTLNLFIEPKLSLLTDSVASVPTGGITGAVGDLAQVKTIPIYDYTKIWSTQVLPKDLSVYTDLSQAIDYAGLAPAETVANQINQLTKEVAATTSGKAVSSFCQVVNSHTTKLFLNRFDRLAVLATALRQTPAWNDGSTYMTKASLSSGPNPCISRGDSNLLEAMQVPSGTDSALLANH